MRIRVIVAALSTSLLLSAPPAWGEDDPGFGRTPPRLSYVDGEVSFWRPGAEDWTEGRVNTPLAAGDQLYTGARSILELQIGARAYVRADQETQIGIENHETDFLQLKVTSGRVSLDVRSLNPGQSIEVNTPSAAIVIEEAGYYRADVGGEATTFLVRRGGRALLTPINAAPVTVGSGAAATLRGTDFASVETYAAPEPDTWDGWNDGRSDQLVASVSSQYLPDDAYGAEELDHYGSWRTVPSYGSVWVPRAVAPGWAPYTTGRWIWDGYYGWTWLSYDPWGWAPFHYGRWVYVHDYWAWAPGPGVVSAVYYPALVAFFGGGVSVGVGFGPVGWVALGWGEPIYPWWGYRGFIGQPCWHGWGGPRVHGHGHGHGHDHGHDHGHGHKTRIEKIDGYSNSRHRNAVVVVPRDRFGREGIEKARLRNFDRRELHPVAGRLAVKPTAESLAPKRARATRPPHDVVTRPVVGTRRPHDVSQRLAAEGIRSSRAVPESRVRLVDERRQPRQTRVRRAPTGREETSGGAAEVAPAPADRRRAPAMRPDTPRVAPRSAPPAAERGGREKNAAPRRMAPPAPPSSSNGIGPRTVRPRREETKPAGRFEAPPRSRPPTSSPRRGPSVDAPAAPPQIDEPRRERRRSDQSVTRPPSPRERAPRPSSFTNRAPRPQRAEVPPAAHVPAPQRLRPQTSSPLRGPSVGAPAVQPRVDAPPRSSGRPDQATTRPYSARERRDQVRRSAPDRSVSRPSGGHPHADRSTHGGRDDRGSSRDRGRPGVQSGWQR